MSKRHSTRLLLWICLICLELMEPGCKDLNEVDELNIVLALGIDETPAHQVQVTAEIVDPIGARSTGTQGGGAGRRQTTFVRGLTGKTTEEALNKFDLNVTHRLFLAHNTVIVFGRTYAEHGLDKAMDYLERDRSYRRNQLWVVTDGMASDLLQASGKPESYNAIAIRSLVDQGVQKSVAVNSTQLNVMRQYLRPSHAPNLAYLTVNHAKLREGGIGLFDGSKLKDHLTAKDAQSLLLFLGNTQQTEVVLPCMDSGTVQTDLGNTFQILHTKTDVVPIIDGTNIRFLVKVRGRAEIERLCPGSKASTETFKKFEALLDAEIQDRMRRVFHHLQQDDVDSVQFGTRIFESHPMVWKKMANRWKGEFPNLKVHYDVEIQLLRSGLTSKSPDADFSPQGLPPQAGREGALS